MNIEVEAITSDKVALKLSLTLKDGMTAADRLSSLHDSFAERDRRIRERMSEVVRSVVRRFSIKDLFRAPKSYEEEINAAIQARLKNSDFEIGDPIIDIVVKPIA